MPNLKDFNEFGFFFLLICLLVQPTIVMEKHCQFRVEEAQREHKHMVIEVEAKLQEHSFFEIVCLQKMFI